MAFFYRDYVRSVGVTGIGSGVDIAVTTIDGRGWG